MNGFQRVQLDLDGGGNQLPKDRVSIRRIAAIGDCVAASVVADKLHEQGIPVDFQCHNMIHGIMRRVATVASVNAPSFIDDVNLDGVYEKDPQRKTRHFHSYFIETANNQLKHLGIDLGPPLNCRPSLTVTDAEKELTISKLKQWPRPWVMVCPRSQWFRCRDVPDYIWEREAPKINGTCFWMGMNQEPKGFVGLRCSNIEEVLLYCAAADLVISPDTGPLHLAIAVGTQALAIGQSSDPVLHFSDLCDYETIYANVPCLNCQENRCPINQFTPPCCEIEPDRIAMAANRKLKRNIMSCVIPTFNAPVERLNRCIDAVLSQVDEIIVTADAGGKFPDGARQRDKIRYVQSGKAGLGFGKNCNFGIRHSSGSKILLCNDDVFLNPGTVRELFRAMDSTSRVGMVSHLLRYENGKIYFAGRQRHNGDRGFPHIDHNEFLPTFNEVVEQEAASATSLLVSREAFYKSRCFTEEIFMYAEDDFLSMSIRKSGYRILYTPHGSGVHIGNATTGPTGKMHDWIAQSGKIMEKHWGPYFDHNRNRLPLGNFDYLR
jgi:GT2 family glycosyltransferase/ADP-heptose:LPS heptosyltransferase